MKKAKKKIFKYPIGIGFLSQIQQLGFTTVEKK